MLFENIIKSLIVLPNGYKFTIKKIKITRYPSSFNFHSIFPGYTYPRLIVDRNLVAVQRSITRNRDFFLFFRRELLIAYVNGAAAGSKTFYQALGKIQYRNRGLKRGHIGALLFNSFTNSRLQQSNRSPIFPFANVFEARGEEDGRWREIGFVPRAYPRFDRILFQTKFVINREFFSIREQFQNFFKSIILLSAFLIKFSNDLTFDRYT